MFPREIYVYHTQAFANCVGWTRGKGYQVEYDDGTTANLPATAFGVTSDMDEPLYKPQGGTFVIEDVKERYGQAEAPTSAELAKERVREALSGCRTTAEVAEVASEHLHCSPQDLIDKYKHLPFSRFRMVIGNRLRPVFNT